MERQGQALLKLHRSGLHVDVVDALLDSTRKKLKLFSSLCREQSASLAVCPPIAPLLFSFILLAPRKEENLTPTSL